MKNIEQNRLENIYAGEIGVGAGLLIVGGIVFLIGVIDGFFRPLKCN